MVDKLYYNQDEIIFIGIFFSLLIATFFFLIFYPSEDRLDYQTKKIMVNLNTREMKPIKKNENDKVKPPPSKRIKETVF